eukprot:TRINITY_DN8472_c1_g2_i1.p1 TRINITY_DN8472_c1_g2~~TRINITY_DN8472_c1_g2_i1.p1  ORF type:complete len:268 (+),score=82.56 TRINITY_DN8472_c1_g2_i1:73-804(+)
MAPAPPNGSPGRRAPRPVLDAAARLGKGHLKEPFWLCLERRAQQEADRQRALEEAADLTRVERGREHRLAWQRQGESERRLRRADRAKRVSEKQAELAKARGERGDAVTARVSQATRDALERKQGYVALVATGAREATSRLAPAAGRRQEQLQCGAELVGEVAAKHERRLGLEPRPPLLPSLSGSPRRPRPPQRSQQQQKPGSAEHAPDIRTGRLTEAAVRAAREWIAWRRRESERAAVHSAD